jgi:hypothetical protein
MPQGKPKRSWLYRMSIGYGVKTDPGKRWMNRPRIDGDTNPELPNGPLQQPRGGGNGIGTGFPLGMERPVYMVDPEWGRAQLCDGEGEVRDVWLISDRAKCLFEALDPEAFEFCKVDVRLREKGVEREGPSYWLCDIVRFVDALNEEKSKPLIRIDSNGTKFATPDLQPAVFRREAVNDHHVFRLKYNPYYVCCDFEFRQAVQEAGLTNFRFQRGGRIND